MKIYFATGNAHKREELARILADHEIVMPSDEGIAFDPDETETTFFGNSVLKARALYELTHCPVIADDSGLCVDALGGAPGVLSARYGSESGKKLDSTARNELLLSRMQGMENRACRFVCNMVLYLGPDRFFSAQETLEGSLIDRMRGSGGFGYDPLVLVPELGLTVAELSPEKKDELSHRGKAGRVIARLLSSIS
jgi:XTP/dITP diphosphohydrolase